MVTVWTQSETKIASKGVPLCLGGGEGGAGRGQHAQL